MSTEDSQDNARIMPTTDQVNSNDPVTTGYLFGESLLFNLTRNSVTYKHMCNNVTYICMYIIAREGRHIFILLSMTAKGVSSWAADRRVLTL